MASKVKTRIYSLDNRSIRFTAQKDNEGKVKIQVEEFNTERLLVNTYGFSVDSADKIQFMKKLNKVLNIKLSIWGLTISTQMKDDVILTLLRLF